MAFDPNTLRELIEALIGGFSILGGGMAYASGSNAAKALTEAQPADVVAHRINEGIGRGFTASKGLSILALAIMVLA